MFKSLIRLTKHSAIYGAGHILGRSIGFLLLPIHTNFIAPPEYAVYVLGYAFIPFAAILYSAGLNSAQIRFFLLSTRDQERKDVFTTSFIGTVFIALFFSVILLFFSAELSLTILGDVKYAHLIRICSGILSFDALALLLFNILRAQEKSVHFIAFSIIEMTLNILFNLIFIIKMNMGVQGIFIANLIASGVTLILLLAFTSTHFTHKISKDLLKELFKFGIPVIPSTLSMVILTLIDRFIIQKLLGNIAVGIYGAGYKLGMFMNLIVTGFRYAWFPFSLSIVKEEDAKEVIAKVLTYFLFICGFIFLVISLYIDQLVRVQIFGFTIFGEEYWPGTVIVPAVMASYIFYGVYLIFQLGVYLRGKTIYLALTAGFSAIVNIIANFILIPHLGIMGAAYATLLAYLFLPFSLYFLTNHFYPVKFEWLRIFKLVSLCILLFIAARYSYPDSRALFKLIFIFAYFIILYFIGFYEKREIGRLTKFAKGRLWPNSH